MNNASSVFGFLIILMVAALLISIPFNCAMEKLSQDHQSLYQKPEGAK